MGVLGGATPRLTIYQLSQLLRIRQEEIQYFSRVPELGAGEGLARPLHRLEQLRLPLWPRHGTPAHL
jgi:hypothetical protein